MIAVALKGLAGRKLRAALTAFAIVLGVSMISGTYVLTDTIKAGFDTIFTQSYQNTSVVVTGRSAVDASQNGTATAGGFPQDVLARVRSLPDVGAAVGSIADQAQLIDRNGKRLTTGGAPGLAFSVDPTEPRFNPLTLISGSWPHGPNQIAIDEHTASAHHYRVGDEIGLAARGPEQRYRIVGVAKFGAVSSIGGATLAILDVPTAQAVFDKRGKLDAIRAAAKPGVSDAKLLREVRAVLPATAQARTGAAQAKSDSENTSGFLSFLQKFLLAFGFIALFVGAFVIFNTLSITVAQRTREFATLRTIGASRRQVLRTVLLESLVVAVIASVVGLFAGLGLAAGLNALFVAFGIDLPKAGTVFATRTIVVSLLIGIVITMLASIRPARRATRVPPIAAVREGAVLPPSRFARLGPYFSLLTFALGLVLLVAGVFVHGLATTPRLLALGIGVLLLFLGTALVASRLVPPLAAAMDPLGKWALVLLSVLFYPVSLGFWLLRYALLERGAPAGRRAGAFVGGLLLSFVELPLLLPIVLVMWALRRVHVLAPEWPAEFPTIRPDRTASALARENATRNPQRTASTAAALMIGLALVTAVAVLGQGIRSSFESAVDQLFRGDYAVTATDNFSPISPASAEALARSPVVDTLSQVRGGDGKAFGKSILVSGVDAQLSKVIPVKWAVGSPAVPAHLGRDGAFVSKKYADDHHLGVGSRFTVLSPTAKTLDLTLKGIFDPPKGGSPFGSVTISTASFDANWPQPQNVFAILTTKGGVTDANTKALEAAMKPFPTAKVVTESQFKKNQEAGFNTLLNLLYVLLALSVIVSLFGIVNTLVLTIFERTRELGMLRAIGMTRRQVRRMVRHESVVTSLIGAALGIALGFLLSVLVTQALSDQGVVFAVPWLSLVYFVIAAILVGILAAILPARRASRLNVLEALQYE